MSKLYNKPTVKEIAKSMTPAQRKKAIEELKKRKALREMKKHKKGSTQYADKSYA